MGWRWVEAALPLGIIAGMLCIAGNVQYVIHTKAHGRPKHIGNDIKMQKRENYESSKSVTDTYSTHTPAGRSAGRTDLEKLHSEIQGVAIDLSCGSLSLQTPEDEIKCAFDIPVKQASVSANLVKIPR
ncbi:hypothetical protein SADUNF_Sadunf04G0165400 [Salix dunnii]|uniref:NADH dehydrogenase [ubiquinone] 1 alpha subcomplex subunit 1 n=1 Tax=Salix dunnii TaxID=1413687 RepID=A0A835K637_9ROSI|nr:hypothetical protein SADUNF_Sadunf04G0165400 [Salix dunnii]